MSESNAWPNFSGITPETIKSVTESVLFDSESAWRAIANASHAPMWADLEALEAIENRIANTFSVIHHLHHVQHDPAWDDAYAHSVEQQTEYSMTYLQDPQLYARIQAIAAQADNLTEAQQMLLSQTLRDFRLSGAGLDEEARAQFTALGVELSLLENTFSQNVLQATDGGYVECTDAQRLAGIPAAAVAQAAALAAAQGKPGWQFSLEAPSVEAVLRYAADRTLRQQMHQAHTTRASLPPYDNTPIMQDILKKRRQLAALLGFPDYLSYALQTRMVQTPADLEKFYTGIIEQAKPIATQELADLIAFAKEEGALLPLAPWDISYYSELYCQRYYGIDQESLRPYFSLDRVLEGLFEVLHQLLGISISPCPEAPKWEPTVQCFAIYREGKIRGYFYLDLFARPHKRSGAWMDDARTRTKTQIPLAYIVGNYRAPTEGSPALLTHDDVVTLFHETGHALQHLLTEITDFGISGIHGVPWDAVEIASQWLENWAWEPAVLRKLSCHQTTQVPLPEDMIEKLRASKRFQAGLSVMRQLEYGLLDMRLHQREMPDVMQVLSEVRTQVRLTPAAPYDRAPHTFCHIFSGGYAAGYYSYLWAEVLSADAFSAFSEAGIFDPTTSQRFLDTFLAQGGSRHPSAIFRDFRGRDPDPAAFFRQLQSEGIA